MLTTWTPGPSKSVLQFDLCGWNVFPTKIQCQFTWPFGDGKMRVLPVRKWCTEFKHIGGTSVTTVAPVGEAQKGQMWCIKTGTEFLGAKKVTIQGNWFDNNEKVQMDVNDQMCMDLISTIKNCFSCKLEPIHPLCSGLWRTIRIHQHNTRVTFKAVKTFQFLCQRQTHILNIHHVTGFSM